MTNEKNVAENNSDRLLDVLHIDTDKRNNTTQVTRRGRPKKDISGNSPGKKSENNKPGRPRKDTLRRIKHSQDLIKKGFNVCYVYKNTYDKPSDKSCSLCEALGVPHNHQLSRCSRLSEKDKKFMARLRALNLIDTESDIDEHDDLNGEASIKMIDVRRVSIVQSPILEVSYNTITISMIIDSGATGNFIHINLVAKLGLKMSHTNHNANQADGRAKMNVLGEVKCFLNKGKHKLFFDGLVVSALDAEIIGGSPFQELNDVFARPSKKYVQIGDEKFPYSHDNNDKISSRRMQAHVVSLRRTTTVWPNEDLDIDLPDHMQSEDVVAVEPRSDNCKSSTFSSMWPQPNIVMLFCYQQ